MNGFLDKSLLKSEQIKLAAACALGAGVEDTHICRSIAFLNTFGI